LKCRTHLRHGCRDQCGRGAGPYVIETRKCEQLTSLLLPLFDAICGLWSVERVVTLGGCLGRPPMAPRPRRPCSFIHGASRLASRRQNGHRPWSPASNRQTILSSRLRSILRTRAVFGSIRPERTDVSSPRHRQHQGVKNTSGSVALKDQQRKVKAHEMACS
jgi:hypothetical protein